MKIIYCCNKMQKYLQVESQDKNMCFNTEKGLFRFIAKLKGDPIGGFETVYETMNYCPFCGENLELEKKSLGKIIEGNDEM